MIYKNRKLFLHYTVHKSIGQEETLDIIPIGFQQRSGYSTVLVACLDVALCLQCIFIFEYMLLSLQKEWLGDYIACSAYVMLFKSCASTFPQKLVFSSAMLYCWRFPLLPQFSISFGFLLLISDQTDPRESDSWDLKLFMSVTTFLLLP